METTLFLRESQALFVPLYRISYGILGSRMDAEDAVQQGLMKAWAAKDRANPETFRAWLSRIVINESRNIQRHRMRIVPMGEVRELQESPREPSFQPPDVDVMEALAGLPEALRVPFIMKYAARYKEREIAQALRLPLSTVKNRLSRARKLLRKALSDTEVTFE